MLHHTFNVPRPAEGGTEPVSVGNFRRITISSSSGTKYFRLDLKPEYQITATEAAFSVMFRAVAQTGNVYPFLLRQYIHTPTCIAGMDVKVVNTGTAPNDTSVLNTSNTKLYISDSTSTLNYNYKTNFGSEPCNQQNFWYLIEGYINKTDSNACFLRVDGKKFRSSSMGTTTTSVTKPSGSYIVVEISTTSTIAITLDLGLIYGTWSSTTLDTDVINNVFEPLMDYDTAQAYYSDWPNWLLNLNSDVNPHENIGNNPGVFTNSGEMSLVNENLTLNQIPDGYYRVLKLSTQGTQFCVVSDSQILNPDKPIFMVIIGTPMQGVPSGISYTSKSWSIETISVPPGPDAETGVFLNCMDLAYNSSSQIGLNTQHAIKDKSLSIGKVSVNTALTRHEKSLTVVYTKVDNPGYINSNGDNYSSTTVGTTTAVVNMSDGSSCTQFMVKRNDYTIQEPVQLRYLAVVTGEMIEAHPEIQWTDSTAMSNYFRVGGTTEIVANPRTAIPGVDQYVFYDAHQYRGSMASKSDYEFITYGRTYIYGTTYYEDNRAIIKMVDNPGPYTTSDV